MKRKRAILVARVHTDMTRYLGNPNEVHPGIFVKPSCFNNNWFHGAIGRYASFGIQAIPGFWDDEKQEFTEAWPPEAKKAAEKCWPAAWLKRQALK